MAEAIRIMGWVSTNHCDEGEKEQGEDQDDFAAGEPEFGFTISLDRQYVQETVSRLAFDVEGIFQGSVTRK